LTVEVYGEDLHLLLNPVEILHETRLKLERIEVNLSLIGQDVKIISPKFRLH